ncbi:MAG: DUF6266 family protein [Daejeonella sp.]|uniref:DUF6266 family protein n=1 Tax=Daejeonella sp. TaxID=2805397 RepID=UPI002733158B|nr:DUF6266 family protein [Daejeonella sp.]MDP3467567.1 DUF6266 family protein [Daejeonella sp.]
MAILHHGILGGFSGKVGNIIGYRYKNQYCIRQMPRKSIKPPGNRQIAQREKFKHSMALVSPLRDQLSQLPEKGKRRISAFNCCLSKVLTEVIKGTYPEYSFNYAALQLSSGRLSVGHCHSVYAIENDLIFRWCPDSPDFYLERKLVMLAYNPLRKEWASDTLELRSDDSMGILSLPCSFTGEHVEAYMYFINGDGKAVSDSKYLGSVNLPDTPFSETLINLN